MKKHSVNNRRKYYIKLKNPTINTFLIGLSYGFITLNLTITMIYEILVVDTFSISLLVLTIISILSIPIAVVDKRHEMKDSMAVFFSALSPVIISLIITQIHPIWWLWIVAALEVLIVALIALKSWMKRNCYKNHYNKERGK